MRPIVETVVKNLPEPDGRVLDEARAVSDEPDRHRHFLDRVAALHELESCPPAAPLAWPGRLRIAAFNAQRLKNVSATRALLDRARTDIALLSEVDCGMARSGNGSPIRDLTAAAGEGYLYGVEFVELDLGNAREIAEHRGERNARGFHGNAIATKLPLADSCLIPLEESGFWFPGREGGQRRIGGRMAIAARAVGAPVPLWLVSTHLESKADERDRQVQIQALLRALDRIAPNAACVIGGDFNTKKLPRDADALRAALEEPERFEPLFEDLRRAGFSWADSNLAEPTQHTGPTGKPRPPFGKLDWIVVRGMKLTNPQVLSAVDGEGRPISDHQLIAADLAL